VIKPLIPAATAIILGYVVIKGKPIKSSSDIVQVVSDATSDSEEKSFGGLTLSKINEVVSNTYKGVRAEIDGDTLEYYFESASGKKTATARFILDSVGELVITFLSYNDAKTPRFFIENLRDVMNKAQWSKTFSNKRIETTFYKKLESPHYVYLYMLVANSSNIRFLQSGNTLKRFEWMRGYD